MFLVYITLTLIAVGVIAFLWGAIGLAKFGFRISTPVGLAVLLFPPYTFYFAFFKLEEEGKEEPTAMWLAGLLVAVLLSLIFLPTLQHVVRGEWDQLGDAQGPGAVAEASQGENGANGASANGEADEATETATKDDSADSSADAGSSESTSSPDAGNTAESSESDNEEGSG